MNGSPERWCGRCVGSGRTPQGECPCVRRTTPIARPVRCICGGRYSPSADGSMPRHGSLGWSCDGETMTRTADGGIIKRRRKRKQPK